MSTLKKCIKNIFYSFIESFSLLNMVKFYRHELEKLEQDYLNLRFQNLKLNEEIERLNYLIERKNRSWAH